MEPTSLQTQNLPQRHPPHRQPNLQRHLSLQRPVFHSSTSSTQYRTTSRPWLNRKRSSSLNNRLASSSLTCKYHSRWPAFPSSSPSPSRTGSQRTLLLSYSKECNRLACNPCNSPNNRSSRLSSQEQGLEATHRSLLLLRTLFHRFLRLVHRALRNNHNNRHHLSNHNPHQRIRSELPCYPNLQVLLSRSFWEILQVPAPPLAGHQLTHSRNQITQDFSRHYLLPTKGAPLQPSPHPPFNLLKQPHSLRPSNNNYNLYSQHPPGPTPLQEG